VSRQVRVISHRIQQHQQQAEMAGVDALSLVFSLVRDVHQLTAGAQGNLAQCSLISEQATQLGMHLQSVHNTHPRSLETAEARTEVRRLIGALKSAVVLAEEFQKDLWMERWMRHSSHVETFLYVFAGLDRAMVTLGAAMQVC
jgi:hypothetical protein